MPHYGSILGRLRGTASNSLWQCTHCCVTVTCIPVLQGEMIPAGFWNSRKLVVVYVGFEIFTAVTMKNGVTSQKAPFLVVVCSIMWLWDTRIVALRNACLSVGGDCVTWLTTFLQFYCGRDSVKPWSYDRRIFVFIMLWYGPRHRRPVYGIRHRDSYQNKNFLKKTKRSPVNIQSTRGMASSRMLRRVALVRTEVSKERIASFIRGTRIGAGGAKFLRYVGSYKSHMA
jgi:hypothetical protein